MPTRPSLNDQNIGVFFGARQKQNEKKEIKTPDTRKVTEKSIKESEKGGGTKGKPTIQPKPQSSPKRAAAATKPKQGDVTQLAVWLPANIVQEIKIRCVRENKKIAELTAELLAKSLK